MLSKKWLRSDDDQECRVSLLPIDTDLLERLAAEFDARKPVVLVVQAASRSAHPAKVATDGV